MTSLKFLCFACLLLCGLSLQVNAHDAELLYRMDEVSVEGGKLIKKSKFRIQINNKNGEDYATVQIPYSKISKVSNIEGSLHSADGSLIRKLSSGEIKRRSAVSDMAFYEDDMVAEFSLRHSRYPYIIEYNYECRESEFVDLDYWEPILAIDVPTRAADLSVTVPSGFKLRFSSHLVKEPLILDNGKTTNYKWNCHFDAYRENEILAPPRSTLVPRVEIVPAEFHFEIPGSAESWESLGKWETGLLVGLDDLPDAEKIRINQLIEGVDDTLERAKILYHDLQDKTHYVLVSIETGGLKPYPASYVAMNRYGDCKALTNYMRAVFEYAGIACNYINIHAGEPVRKLDPDFPSERFNHVMLLVPLENDSLWLDCTSKGPFGYVGTSIQNRDVFVVSNKGSYLSRTPALGVDEVAELRTIRIKYPSPVSSTVSFDCRFRGEKFEYYRALGESFNADDRTRLIRKYFIEDGFELQDYSISKEDRDSAFITVSYQTTTSRFYQNYGNETIVKNLPFGLPRLQKPAQRQFPVQLDKPDFECDTLFYEIPEGLKVSGVAENVNFETEFGNYKLTLETTATELKVVKQLLVNAGKYPLEKYPAFYDFIDKVKNFEAKPLLILQH